MVVYKWYKTVKYMAKFTNQLYGGLQVIVCVSREDLTI